MLFSSAFLFSFFFSAFSLAPFHFCRLKGLLSFTMPFSLAKCFVHYCVSVITPSSSRSCIVCDRPIHDRCDANKKFAAMKTTKLSLLQNHHLACSCAYWSVEYANSPRSRGVSVQGKETASVRALQKEFAPPSTSLLGKIFSLAPLHLQKVPPPAPVRTATDVVEVSVPTACTSPPVSQISAFVKIEYRVDGLRAGQPAQDASLNDRNPLKKCITWTKKAVE